MWFARDNELVAFDPETDTVVRRFGRTGASSEGSARRRTATRASGMAWADGYLFIGQFRESRIHNVDAKTGEVVKTMTSDRFVTGVSCVDGALLVAPESAERGGRWTSLPRRRPASTPYLESSSDRASTAIAGAPRATDPTVGASVRRWRLAMRFNAIAVAASLLLAGCAAESGGAFSWVDADGGAPASGGGTPGPAPGADGAAPAGGQDGAASTPVDPSLPRFPTVGHYATVIAARSDPADVYYPAPPDLEEHRGELRFPVVALMQGAKVDKSNYESVSRGIAAYGFVVIVANHKSALSSDLFPDEQLAVDVLAHAKAEALRDGAPIHEIADGTRFGLMGHSFGGVAGVEAILGSCSLPFCLGTFPRPPELRAGVFYGTNLNGLLSTGSTPDLDTSGIALALVQGSLDGKALPADASATYAKLKSPPRAVFKIEGANHYGVCGTNNPPGADADANVPTLAQAKGIAAIATWGGLFLRAFLERDAASLAYLKAHDRSADGVVTVTSDYGP